MSEVALQAEQVPVALEQDSSLQGYLADKKHLTP